MISYEYTVIHKSVTLWITVSPKILYLNSCIRGNNILVEKKGSADEFRVSSFVSEIYPECCLCQFFLFSCDGAKIFVPHEFWLK